MNVRNGYKVTELGEIPCDWEVCPIGKYIKLVLRETQKPNTSYVSVGVRSHGKGTFHKFVERPETVMMDKLYIVKENDLIVNITFAWEHAVAIAKKEDGGLLVSHRFPTYEIDQQKIVVNYLRYLILQERFREKLELISPGGAGRNRVLSKKDFINIDIPIPPFHEQQQIAEVLSTNDIQILKIDEIINKTNEVKQGMMQELFTKGIGQKEFKDSTLGEIPKEWEVKKMKEICSIFVGIATSTTEHYVDSGVPLIRNQNIKENYLDSEELLYISEEFSEKNKNKKLLAGDVITVRTGYPGVSCVVTPQLEGSQSFTTLISRPNNKVVLSDFLAYYINSDIGKRYIFLKQAGGAQQNLNVSSLNEVKVPLPPITEQREIASILFSIDEKINVLIKRKHQLEEIKRGLMQDLLVGRVRVNVD